MNVNLNNFDKNSSNLNDSNIDEYLFTGQTHLTKAVIHDDFPKIQRLIISGASVNKSNLTP